MLILFVSLSVMCLMLYKSDKDVTSFSTWREIPDKRQTPSLRTHRIAEYLLKVLVTFSSPFDFKKVAGRRVARVEEWTPRLWRRILEAKKRPGLPAIFLTSIRRGVAGKERARSAIKDGLCVKSILNKLILIDVIPIYYGKRRSEVNEKLRII